MRTIPTNPRLADEYGIVMGTSHHEPMMRAHKEWTTRRAQYGNGKWNYATQLRCLEGLLPRGHRPEQGLREPRDDRYARRWRRGHGHHRQHRVRHQAARARHRGSAADPGRGDPQTDPARIPQLWALFTEVQKFYEHGMRVPDDVTLLWTDDNTGNLRRLPTAEERKRSGGAGIYYHIDMHGGPYAYQWINTNPSPEDLGADEPRRTNTARIASGSSTWAI